MANNQKIEVNYATGGTTFSYKPAILEINEGILRLYLPDSSGNPENLIVEAPLNATQSISRAGNRVGLKIDGKNYNIGFKGGTIFSNDKNSPAVQFLANFNGMPIKKKNYTNYATVGIGLLVIYVISLMLFIF